MLEINSDFSKNFHCYDFFMETKFFLLWVEGVNDDERGGKIKKGDDKEGVVRFQLVNKGNYREFTDRSVWGVPNKQIILLF